MMADNIASVTYVTLPATNPASHLIKGLKWGGGLGKGVTLTYSFATPQAGGYATIRTLTNTEESCVELAIRNWAAIANISLHEVSETTTTVGDLRFAKTALASGALNAYAYTPSSSAPGGDVWFVDKVWNSDGFATGSYAAFTVLHELGHALGLRHAFEGSNPLPAVRDNLFNTVMSYTASSQSKRGDIYASYYPTTPMYYDLLSMQALYGRNKNHSTGDTTYEFRDDHTYFRTLDDASGNDAMRYVGDDDVQIDLRPGHASMVSKPVHFTGYSTRATVFVGPGTVIERATGGHGDDTLIGNSSPNVLTGGMGQDTMTGYAGRDTFRFNRLTESGNSFGTGDVIVDFLQGSDRISLPKSADLIWRGSLPFSNSSDTELRFININHAGTNDDWTLVLIDADSDTSSESMIKLKGLHSLSGEDFIM